ncbi:MAG TPA: ATP-dependent DNA ligase [Xanthobacteraceae bacterium]|nr:ATP-dependent DNA ligase [Xanthobacteraceae bacterium]
MPLELRPPIAPMEALPVDAIPTGPDWQYEPKWDGFRCLAFRDGGEVKLQSKAGRPLNRYFPEMVEALGALDARAFVLDGELAVPAGRGFSFDALLQRIHPAASRVRRLAAETPAIFIAFDLLAGTDGRSLMASALMARRQKLEELARRYFPDHPRIRLSPTSPSVAQAAKWLEQAGPALDGIIAKRRGSDYRPGERTAMQKVKNYRSADCVVGGFRYGADGKAVGSLLLGLYDKGLLHHVGFTSGIRASERKALTAKLERLIAPPGFTGNAPGGPSRWAAERSGEWKPLKPKLVVEVCFDHFSGGRFRHGTRLLRWRPDKAPRQCTMDQIRRGGGNVLRLLFGGTRRAQ